MLQVEYTAQFKRDLKLSKRRNKKLGSLHAIMSLTESEKPLSKKIKDHSLSGNWTGHRELHIEADWLLIYKIIPSQQTVIFVRTGTHADLFK